MEKEISFGELYLKFVSGYRFLMKKWLLITLFVIFSSTIGLIVSFRVKSKYNAELTFVLEEESEQSSGGIASLASTFGFSGLGGGGGLFTSTNIIEFLKSRTLIEKTLLSPYDEKLTFIDKYIKINEIDEQKNFDLKKIKFDTNEDRSKFTVTKDSVLALIFNKIIDQDLNVSKPKKENTIILISFICTDELFAQKFTERLLEVTSDFYIKTKIEKSQINTEVLQKQTDSVRRELYSSISGAASESDQVFGLNPALNVQRVPSIKKQVDVQANTAILTELVKNLELSKMNLLNQTPLIQVVDKPVLPLKQMKISKFKGIFLGGIIGGGVIISFLFFKQFLSNIKNQGGGSEKKD